MVELTGRGNNASITMNVRMIPSVVPGAGSFLGGLSGLEAVLLA